MRFDHIIPLQITADDCRKAVGHCIKIEDDYRQHQHRVDEEIRPVVFSVSVSLKWESDLDIPSAFLCLLSFFPVAFAPSPLPPAHIFLLSASSIYLCFSIKLIY